MVGDFQQKKLMGVQQKKLDSGLLQVVWLVAHGYGQLVLHVATRWQYQLVLLKEYN